MAKIAFVQNLAYEYLGVMYLSSLLKKNRHDTDIFIEHGQGMKELVEEIKRFSPDIVGLPCTTGMHHWVLAAASVLKSKFPGSKIILGGPHPTFFPDIVQEDNVDVICRGEGECALLEFAEAIDNGRDYSSIKNLWVKKGGEIFRNDVRPLIDDLDQLPFPDRDLYIKKYFFLVKSQEAFITGRGCPFSCAYCFNHAYKKLYHGKGAFMRQRSVDNVIAEIKHTYECNNNSMRIVYIQDDTFILNKKWVLLFLEKYKSEVKLPFICQVRADLINEEIVSNLKEAGCLNVFFGVETGVERMRNALLKKDVSDKQIFETAALLKKYSIRFRTYNMFGLPEESLNDAYETVKLNIKINTDYPWSSLFQPFPGTELGDYVKKNNMLEDDRDQFEPSFFTNSSIKLDDKDAIENLKNLFFYAVKFPYLFPLIKWAVKRNFKKLYNKLFLLGYMWAFKKSEGISWSETFRIGKNNIKNFFSRNETFKSKKY